MKGEHRQTSVWYTRRLTHNVHQIRTIHLKTIFLNFSVNTIQRFEPVTALNAYELMF